jgi:hypothetical protein
MVSCFDFAEISKRNHQADRAVPAHCQAAAVVEENYTGDALCIAGFTEQRPYHCFGTAGLGDQGPAECFVVPLKELPPRVQVAIA